MSRGEQPGGARPRRLRRWFAVPADLRGAERRRARTLMLVSTVLTALILPVSAFAVVALPEDRQAVSLILAGALVYCLTRLALARRHTVLAGWAYVTYFILVPLNSLYLPTQNAVTSVDLVFVSVIPLMAALVLPRRHVLIATGIATVELAVLSTMTAFVAFSPSEYAAYAFILLCIVGSAAVVLTVTIDRAFEKADRTRVEAERLADELQVANVELEQRVRSRTTELADALQREQQLSSALAELSIRDSLTGLHNRRHLNETIDQMFRYALRSGAPLSVAMIDLDDFKPINDRHTHLVGDDVLKQAATLMGASTRGADELIRMGGEEFALLMPGTSTAEAVTVCERMRTSLAAWDWNQIHAGISLTASFGVATTGTAADPTALLREADEQLLSAKRAGKNRVMCSTADVL
jgi:diguanylate cyclase (GGDEF)-like protein